MRLQDRLDEFKRNFESGATAYRVSRQAIEAIHRATDELVQFGLAAKALNVGDGAPDFRLDSQDGKSISSVELRTQGPLVVTFFRGHW